MGNKLNSNNYTIKPLTHNIESDYYVYMSHHVSLKKETALAALILLWPLLGAMLLTACHTSLDSSK